MRERAGIIMDWKADKDGKIGDIVTVGTVVGVTNNNYKKDDLVALTCEGVFELPKASDAIGQGAEVYVADGKIAATGTVKAGVAWAAAEADDEVVMVKLNA